MRVSNIISKPNRKYFWIIGICLIIQFFIFLIKNNTLWVEMYYSRKLYPIIGYFNKFLFSWIPFSFGDLFYVAVICYIFFVIIRFFKCIIRRTWKKLLNSFFHFLVVLLSLYTFFYVNWGLNYYRQPLYESTGLNLDTITKEDYFFVLEKYIHKANDLRSQLNLNDSSKIGVKEEVQTLMSRDTLFASILSKTQVKIKEPISSKLISYFTVSGYFNPFTSEVQVNQEIPKPSYPFVNVHELAHQMGIGFEDDCNYIAFRELVNHDNLWYQYSAYYNAIQSLIQPLYNDEVLFNKYKAMLSDSVREDLREESLFWRSYSGWVDQISSIFYNGYLKHNNQPEGLQRYNMMARLIVAWEKQR